MAEIVDTVIREDGQEPQDQRLIHEWHTDSLAAIHHYSYYATSVTDVNGIASARATWLPGWLAEVELARNLEEF